MSSNVDFTHRPEWFLLCSELHNVILDSALEHLASRNGPDVHLNLMPLSAVHHFINCLTTSEEANRKGMHAVAISLLRQCVEALVVIDAGLQDVPTGDMLLGHWRGEKTAGQMRQLLEQHVWRKYGRGLWNETWSDFFAKLASAVQPYAHYGPQLQFWQIATLGGPYKGEDGSLQFLAQVGLTAYDPLKATRITLFHGLLLWSLAELILTNGGSSRLDTNAVAKLRAALAASDLLDGEQTKWDQQFWGTLFFTNPNHQLK